MVPFGYAKDPEDRHKFVIAEEEAATVRRIFSMYADGMSTVEISGILNEEKVKTPARDEKLAVLLSEAENQFRAYGRMKEHKAFAVRKLTPELLDEYVEGIEVHPGDEVRIRWK